MPNLTASIPHQLTRAEVKRRIQHQIGVMRRQPAAALADLKEAWTGDTMNFTLAAMGQMISGDMKVDDQMVHVNVALPGLLSMLAGTIKQKIEKEMRPLLSGPAKKTTAS